MTTPVSPEAQAEKDREEFKTSWAVSDIVTNKQQNKNKQAIKPQKDMGEFLKTESHYTVQAVQGWDF